MYDRQMTGDLQEALLNLMSEREMKFHRTEIAIRAVS